MKKRCNISENITNRYEKYPINILHKICRYKYGRSHNYEFINSTDIQSRMLLVIDQLDIQRKNIIEMRFRDGYQLNDIGNKYHLTDSGVVYKINRCIKFIADNYINDIIYNSNNIINIPEHRKITVMELDHHVVTILYHEKIYSIDDILLKYNTPSLIENNRNQLMEICRIGESTYTYIVNQLKYLGLIDNIIPWKESDFKKGELVKKYNEKVGGYKYG